jgi:hypothetical protein
MTTRRWLVGHVRGSLVEAGWGAEPLAGAAEALSFHALSPRRIPGQPAPLYWLTAGPKPAHVTIAAAINQLAEVIVMRRIFAGAQQIKMGGEQHDRQATPRARVHPVSERPAATPTPAASVASRSGS